MDIAKTAQDIAIVALPIIIAVSFHEAAHGFVANRLGDPTARMLGRLTLNPLRHIDLFGTVLIPLMLIVSQAGIIFGYAKPVPVNNRNFKDPKKDMVWVAGSGPLTNFSLALVSGILFRMVLFLKPDLLQFSQTGGGLLSHGGISASIFLPLLLMLKFSVQINVILGVFNLIPLPPLDGGRVMMGILPDHQAQLLGRIEPFGFFILLFLILFDPLGLMSHFVFGVMEFLFKIFMFL
jgi:Zn-dependent protease